RQSLRRVFLLIDARHGLKANDLEIMGALDKAALVYQVVLTKTDKLKASERETIAQQTLTALAKRPAAHPALIATSAEKNDGIDLLRAEIAALLDQ
ncbi:MAG: YihA family ribosome biogenesis GTP-binding protein, partial [Hyphomonadaceae bacterium]